MDVLCDAALELLFSGFLPGVQESIFESFQVFLPLLAEPEPPHVVADPAPLPALPDDPHSLASFFAPDLARVCFPPVAAARRLSLHSGNLAHRFARGVARTTLELRGTWQVEVGQLHGLLIAAL
eukprot:7537351-Pyramimonas_sp.AAC.1